MRKYLDHWPSFCDPASGQTFVLDHLNAFTINICQKPSKGKPASIPCRITFSHHCFTDALKHGQECDPDQIYLDPNNEGRVFCNERYEVSIEYLRDLVEVSFSNGDTKCFKDKKHYHSYLLIKGIDFRGRSVSYEVYFVIEKSKTKSGSDNVLIDTAFIRVSRNLRRIRGDRISIGVLAGKKLKGQK